MYKCNGLSSHHGEKNFMNTEAQNGQLPADPLRNLCWQVHSKFPQLWKCFEVDDHQTIQENSTQKIKSVCVHFALCRMWLVNPEL